MMPQAPEHQEDASARLRPVLERSVALEHLPSLQGVLGCRSTEEGRVQLLREASERRGHPGQRAGEGCGKKRKLVRTHETYSLSQNGYRTVQLFPPLSMRGPPLPAQVSTRVLNTKV